MEQNPKKNWNRVEVEREIEQGGEVCRAPEQARTLIRKAELFRSTKGMPLKPTKLGVKPTQG